MNQELIIVLWEIKKSVNTQEYTGLVNNLCKTMHHPKCQDLICEECILDSNTTWDLTLESINEPTTLNNS